MWKSDFYLKHHHQHTIKDKIFIAIFQDWKEENCMIIIIYLLELFTDFRMMYTQLMLLS